MRIEEIRRKTQLGQFTITDHAMIEAFKDGISVRDILFAIENGVVIENYADRDRSLIYGKSKEKVPLHVIIEYALRTEVEIVTVYIPDPRKWIKFRIRK